MARMIPPNKPVENDSRTAEPSIYYELARQLSDEFIVIHSLPWLAQIASKFDGKPAPTGEIDFLILHPRLGILAIEVKGGKLRYDKYIFVYPNGQQIDPVRQIRRSIHALANWIKEAGGPAYRVGYALAFPESYMHGRPLPPAIADPTAVPPENICIDRTDLHRIGQRVQEIMHYWRESLRIWTLSSKQIDTIIDLICPVADYSPRWMERIEETTQRWLVLTPEQAQCLKQIEHRQRAVITGRSGTGKTLLAITRARQLSEQGHKVLFLVYNVQLATLLGRELSGTSIEVTNFHQLCRVAARQIGKSVDKSKENWYREEAPQLLKQAIDQRKLPSYSALLIDEAQVFHQDWLTDLERWFANKPIVACCDETQVFSYETKSSVQEIVTIFRADMPFLLTCNMRSPRPVFERLRQAVEAEYQQISLRSDESNALEELVVPDPLEHLHHTLQQLHAEGIPPDAIMVIYFGEEPKYKPDVERFVGQTISAYRCRGLEAPVVVVLADRTNDDTALACAYTRATSRCIVIYYKWIFLFSKHGSFHRLLYEEDSLIRDWVEETWPPTRKFALTPITSHLAEISWAHQWGGWFVQDRPNERVTDDLWTAHLMFTSRFRTYRYDLHRERFLSVYLPQQALVMKRTVFYSPLLWCDACQWWARMAPLEGGDSFQCLDCAIRTRRLPIPQEAQQYQALEQRLLSDRPRESFEQDSIFMGALQLWKERLSFQQQSVLAKYAAGLINGALDFTVARLLTGIEIMASRPGQEIRTAELQQRYWEMYQWLADHADRTGWNRAIAVNLGTWFTRKWIEKKEKGVYRVVPLPEKDSKDMQ